MNRMTMFEGDGAGGPRPAWAGALGALVFAALVLAPAAAIAHDPAHDPELVEVQSTKSFDDAAAGIRDGLKARKMAIIRQIHFHDMLAAVNVDSERAVTYETFHPRFGKVIYANDKSAFIELPLRIHLRETDGGVVVRYRRPSTILAPYQGLADLGAELDQIFADVVDRATK